jgi:hypothetical protein
MLPRGLVDAARDRGVFFGRLKQRHPGRPAGRSCTPTCGRRHRSITSCNGPWAIGTVRHIPEMSETPCRFPTSHASVAALIIVCSMDHEVAACSRSPRRWRQFCPDHISVGRRRALANLSGLRAVKGSPRLRDVSRSPQARSDARPRTGAPRSLPCHTVEDRADLFTDLFDVIESGRFAEFGAMRIRQW